MITIYDLIIEDLVDSYESIIGYAYGLPGKFEVLFILGMALLGFVLKVSDNISSLWIPFVLDLILVFISIWNNRITMRIKDTCTTDVKGVRLKYFVCDICSAIKYFLIFVMYASIIAYGIISCVAIVLVITKSKLVNGYITNGISLVNLVSFTLYLANRWLESLRGRLIMRRQKESMNYAGLK